MAKKKNNNKGNNNSTNNVERDRTSSDDAAAPATQPPPQTAAAADNSTKQKAVEDMGIEELRAELLAARAELSRVKKSGMSAATTAAPGQLQTQTPEVNELHTKLQRLRQEQAEADAARDKAWKQLKAVVEEISTLANPSYLQSIVVRPTAAE